MREFGFGQDLSALDFASFGGGPEESSGHYIPEARDCISCGVCTGSCPTYKVNPKEPFGPRGRVRMIERVLRRQEVLSVDELEAFEACTLCRACETVCPSKMAYGELYLQAVEAMDLRPQRSRAVKLVHSLMGVRGLRQRLLDGLIRLYQLSGMQRVLRRVPFSPLRGEFKALEGLLPVPHLAERVPLHTQAQTPVSRGVAGLFTGCMANLFDTQTHNATIKLLTRLGYDVRVIEQQTCCGATYAHNGELERARACARLNQEAFAQAGVDAIIFNSSGCGAFLNEYPALLNPDESEGLEEVTPSATDILDFLAAREWPDDVEFLELKLKVAVHEPCSQRNLLGNSGVIYDLLARIPGLEIIPLPDNQMCCGAGGTKMVSQPELADPPRDEKVEALLQSEADLLISSNLSCALHLASGIRQAGGAIEVLHPVRLLARQLK